MCWAGFEDLRPKAASPRGTPREGSGSLYVVLEKFPFNIANKVYYLGYISDFPAAYSRQTNSLAEYEKLILPPILLLSFQCMLEQCTILSNTMIA